MTSAFKSIRQEWEGKVFRLFPDLDAAHKAAVLLARGVIERFTPQMHESQNGWIVLDRETGSHYDEAGLVQ